MSQSTLSGKRILVTGGAGFIGSHTVEALVGAGAEVVVFDNFSAGRLENLAGLKEVKIVEGDIRDFGAVRKAMAGVYATMHLAAQVSVRASVQNPADSAAHNVSGFVNVLQAARENSLHRVVYASSAAVYGMPVALPVTESSPVAPLSPYGLEKLIDEQYAALFARLYGMRCLGLRYFNVYGPRQDPSSEYAGVISRFVDLARRDAALTIFGDGEQTRDFVFVRDIAQVNLAAISSDEEGVVAVGTGRSVSLRQLVSAIEYSLGRKADLRFAPAAQGDIRYSAMDPGRLQQRLGWVPSTMLEEGIAVLMKDCG